MGTFNRTTGGGILIKVNPRRQRRQMKSLSLSSIPTLSDTGPLPSIMNDVMHETFSHVIEYLNAEPCGKYISILEGKNNSADDKESENEDAVLGKINALHDILKEDTQFMSIPEEFITQLEIAIQNFLFSTPTPIPLLYEFDELKLTLRRQKWREIESIFHIISILLRFERFKRQETFMINRHFMYRLVKLYNSPDRTEVATIDALIDEVKELFPSTLKDLYFSLIQIIEEHNDDNIQYYAVKPALQQLHRLISNKKQLYYLPVSIFPLHVLLRLFNSSYLGEFYEMLRVTIRAVYMLSPFDQNEVLNYLFKHWPIQSTSKSIIFLRHCIMIVRDFKPTLLKPESAQLMGKIKSSISSTNFKVSTKAISLILKTEVLKQLKRSFPINFFYDLILDLERISQETWCTSVSDYATKAVEVIKQFLGLKKIYSFQKPNNYEEENENREINWNIIISTAKQENDAFSDRI